MIFTIARYYGTAKAMTTLLTSIATDVITQCSEHLVQRKANNWLWEDDPGKLVGRLNDCQVTNDAFHRPTDPPTGRPTDPPNHRPTDPLMMPLHAVRSIVPLTHRILPHTTPHHAAPTGHQASVRGLIP